MNLRHWAVLALPRHARDHVLADLLEEAAAAPATRGPNWVAWQLLAVAWAYWRADLLQPAALRALACGVAGFVLLQSALVPAAHSLIAAAVVLGPAWQPPLATLWGAPAAMAAVVGGLVIGMVRQPAGVRGDAWRLAAVIAGAGVSAAVAALFGGAGAAAAGSPGGNAGLAAGALVALAVAVAHRRGLESNVG